MTDADFERATGDPTRQTMRLAATSSDQEGSGENATRSNAEESDMSSVFVMSGVGDTRLELVTSTV